MAKRKHDLDSDAEISGSEGSGNLVKDGSDSDRGYDSEAEDLRKGGRGVRAVKRRRTSLESANDDTSQFQSDKQNQVDLVKKLPRTQRDISARAGSVNDEEIDHEQDYLQDYDDENSSVGDSQANGVVALRRVQKSSEASKARTRLKQLKTGVAYLPRVPPFMKPGALKKLIEPYTRHGIGRLFLTPEPAGQRRQRLGTGGNRKRTFVDGWIEFNSKTDAKAVVAHLNGNTIGGKKSSWWHDDVWSLRYLSGFKWSDLVGERRDEEAEQRSRLDAERRQANREAAIFVKGVESSKVAATRRNKQLKRLAKEAGGESAVGDPVAAGMTETVTQQHAQRSLSDAFSQRARRPPAKEFPAPARVDASTRRVLQSIF